MKGLLKQVIQLFLVPLSALPVIAQEETAPVIQTESGLSYSVIEPGSGPGAAEGDTVWIFEITAYRSGHVIYSNMDSNSPIRVVIGAGQATAGMDEGLRGMQAGELRKLILTPDLARRDAYPDNLSPDSSLVITVRLQSIE